MKKKPLHCNVTMQGMAHWSVKVRVWKLVA